MFESEDSDDVYDAGFRPALPKERPREHFCTIFKEADLYGIEPSFFIGGKPKFKSWWGAFFSYMAIGTFIYYVYIRVISTLDNQASHFMERNKFLDYTTELGR